MLKRIVLSIFCSICLFGSGCLDYDGQAVADDQPDQADGIGTSPLSGKHPKDEPGPTDSTGVIKSVSQAKKILLVQIEGQYVDWTQYQNASGNWEVKIVTDSQPVSELRDLGELYYDLDPTSLEVSLVPPICLPGAPLPCPTWPSRTGTGGCVCRPGPPMTGCCPFGPSRRP